MDFARFTLIPVILTQGLWVAKHTPSLPEPEGPRAGTMGAGPDLRVLIVGDSSAVGVGVSDQEDALSGQVARRLGRDYAVYWKVIAKTGATAGETVQRLKDAAPDVFDVAIVALGVNDSKNAVGAAAWDAHYRDVLDILTTRFHVEHIIASGIPPLEDFPALPNPLRSVLSQRARHFDGIMQDIVSDRPHTTYLAPPDRLDPDHMAADGFHAGAPIYATWGRLAAKAIQGCLT